MKSGAESSTAPLPRGAALFDRIDYRLIETPEDRDSLYRFDDAPNVWNFGVYVDNELCSAVRIHILTAEWRASYTTEVFGDVLHPRLDRGEVFVDPCRFVADPEMQQRFPELPYLTVRLPFVACEHFNADVGLAMVRTDHQAFYRRVFLSEPLTEPRPFPGWHSKKVILMGSDYPKVRERILTRFPIMRSSAFERRMLFERSSQRKTMPRPVLVTDAAAQA
jgi:hypothetical protein